jgi:hypothetical protein
MTSADTTLHNSNATRDKRELVSTRRLLWAAPLAAVLAAALNLGVLAIAVALGAVPSGFPLLNPGSVIGSSVVGVILGAVVFALLARLTRHPVRTFRIVAVVALLLSFGTPIIAATGRMPDAGTVTAGTVATMLLMHVVAAGVAVTILPALTRARTDG